jgi:hypothetical protein
MIRLIDLFIIGADEKEFANWIIKYCKDIKDEAFTNNEFINDLQIYYKIKEAKFFKPENQSGRILIEWIFYYYSEDVENETE